MTANLWTKEVGSSVIILRCICCIKTVTDLCIICVMTTFNEDVDDDMLLSLKLQRGVL